MRLFWILRLWIYSIFMGSFNVLGYLGKPIFFKGFSKIYFGKDVRVFPGARIDDDFSVIAPPKSKVINKLQ